MSINSTPGSATANSYVSTASADAYFNARENSDSWIDIVGSTNATAATTRKENLLKMATREIDNTYRFQESKYNGGDRGSSDYQPLEFPRSSNYDTDSNLYIPDEIQDATCEQALWIMERTGKRTEEDGAVIDKQVVGRFSFNYMKGWVNRQVRKTGAMPWYGNYG